MDTKTTRRKKKKLKCRLDEREAGAGPPQLFCSIFSTDLKQPRLINRDPLRNNTVYTPPNQTTAPSPKILPRSAPAGKYPAQWCCQLVTS